MHLQTFVEIYLHRAYTPNYAFGQVLELDAGIMKYDFVR